MGDLRDLLTGEVSQGRKLFETMSDAARCIAELRPKHGQDVDQRQRNLNAFLTQIDKGCRRSNDALGEAILEAVAKRLEGDSDELIECWTRRTNDALAVLRHQQVQRHRPRLASQDADAEMQELLRYARDAETHFIVANTTAENLLAEGETVSAEVDELRRILIQRLGLFVGPGGGFAQDAKGNTHYDEQFNPGTKYTFCLPDHENCARFWAQLFQEVTGYVGGAKRGDEPTPEQAAEAFDIIDGKVLTVMVRPQSINPIPIVGYDLLIPGKAAAAFVLSYTGINRGSVAKLSDKDLEAWTFGTYASALSPEFNPGGVRWRDVKTAVNAPLPNQ